MVSDHSERIRAVQGIRFSNELMGLAWEIEVVLISWKFLTSPTGVHSVPDPT